MGSKIFNLVGQSINSFLKYYYMNKVVTLLGLSICLNTLFVTAQNKKNVKKEQRLEVSSKNKDNTPRSHADILKEEEKNTSEQIVEAVPRKQKPVKRGRTKKNIVRVATKN